jgi:hypothetical protein
MLFQNLPNEIINIILEYEGSVLYKRGKYVNVIHKHDIRYDIIESIFHKKMEIMKEIEFAHKSSYYFEFGFDIDNRVGLCYDYNFSYPNKFEICYYDLRDSGIIQIRTYL